MVNPDLIQAVVGTECSYMPVVATCVILSLRA